MSNILISLAADFVGKKAFKEAETATSKLEKSVKRLGKTLGVALTAQAIVGYGKAAAKAFMEDEAAATRLAGAVKNLGIEMESSALSTYVSNMERFTGVADDQLRPALQALLTTTKSLIASQELLNQAIDISRGSGQDLATVSNDLAQAYVGNLKGLRKYNLGLTQAQLKAMSFAEIQAKLNAQFSGASAAYLETYAGKMEKLTTGAKNAQETIGKGLIDALIALGNNQSIDGLNEDINRLADGVARLLVGLGQVGGKAAEGFSIMGNWIDVALAKMEPLSLAIFGVFLPAESAGTPDLGSYLDRAYASKRADEKLTSKYLTAKAKADKAAKDAAAKAAKLLAANTAELKKQALLKKAASMFDMEQIQIIAALKGKISDEDRMRLELQLAIATGNDKLASDLTYKLAIAQGLTVKLAQELASLPMANNPFAAWAGYLDAIELQAKRIAAFGVQGVPVVTPSGATALAAIPMTTYGQGTYVPSSTYADIPATGLPSTKYNAGTYVPSSAYADRTPIVVQIDGKAVASAMQDQSLNGNQTIVNRTTGSFSDW